MYAYIAIFRPRIGRYGYAGVFGVLGVCILVRILIRLIGGWYICLLRVYIYDINMAAIRVG